MSMKDISRWEDEGGQSWKAPCADEKKQFEHGQTHEHAGQEEDSTCRGLVPSSHQWYTRNECLRFLHEVSIQAIVSTREYISKQPTREYIGAELITVSPNDTLDRIVKVLCKHRISCVPVLDPSAPIEYKDFKPTPSGSLASVPLAPWTKTEAIPNVFCGFIDMLDVVTFIAASTLPELQRNTLDAERVTAIMNTTARSIIDRSHKNPSYPLCEEQPVTDAVQLFGRGVHRALLYSAQLTPVRVTGLCSQWDIVRYVSEQFEQGKAVGMAKRTLKEYGLSTTHAFGEGASVLSIGPDATVLDAVTKMAMNGVQALAVVDPKQGRLIGCFAANDVGKAFYEHFEPEQIWGRLFHTVGAYLDMYKQEPLFDLPELSLESACKHMVQSHAHHMWIVDSLETMRPTAMVSLSDVCRVLLDFEWPKLKWAQGQEGTA